MYDLLQSCVNSHFEDLYFNDDMALKYFGNVPMIDMIGKTTI